MTKRLTSFFVVILFFSGFDPVSAQTSPTITLDPSQENIQTELTDALQKLIQILQMEIALLEQQAKDRNLNSAPIVSIQPSVYSNSTFASAASCEPATSECGAGYHPCTGSGCLHIGEIVSSDPYNCVTNPNPITIVAIPAGAVWPASSCYNNPPNPNMGLIDQSVDYFGCQLTPQCVPNG